MHVCLFGGSFNPPHLGHQIVISQAFELIGDLDEIWLLPTYRHTFSKNASLVDVAHRLEMSKFLLNGKVKLETCEIDQKMSGQTIDAVEYLQAKHPEHQFSFLMGSDQLKTFDQWGSWQKLLKLIPFYIYPRAGYDAKPLFPNMTALTHPLQIVTNISSTNIRKRLQAKLSVKHLLSKPVAEYLETNNLY